MSQYLYTIPLLFITIFCMLFLTATNQYISRDHKKGFFIVFLGEFFIIVFEMAPFKRWNLPIEAAKNAIIIGDNRNPK